MAPDDSSRVATQFAAGIDSSIRLYYDTPDLAERSEHECVDDDRTSHLFSYLSPEQRVPADHPLRTIRAMTDGVLHRLSPRFEALYASTGRPSVPPEQLLRALLLQVLHSVRSERRLMEQLQYNLLFRWFVGLDMDDLVWTPTTFTKNRERSSRTSSRKRESSTCCPTTISPSTARC